MMLDELISQLIELRKKFGGIAPTYFYYDDLMNEEIDSVFLRKAERDHRGDDLPDRVIITNPGHTQDWFDK